MFSINNIIFISEDIAPYNHILKFLNTVNFAKFGKWVCMYINYFGLCLIRNNVLTFVTCNCYTSTISKLLCKTLYELVINKFQIRKANILIIKKDNIIIEKNIF